MPSPRKPSGPVFSRALVALHRSHQDADLLAYVNVLAQAGALGELHFVHVTADTPGDQVLIDMKAETDNYLSDLPASTTVKHALRTGALLDRLLEYAAKEAIDVIFVGNRQDHPIKRSLARRLAKLAPCSIWLVPDGSSAATNRILVPIDFSPCAADALNVASRLASLVGLTELTALHVYFEEARTTYEGADQEIRGRESAAIDAFVKPIDTFGVNVQPLFREGVHPAHTIQHVAGEIKADLIVMETRGRTMSAAILLGSVAEETLSESKAPVLVVKHSAAQIGLMRAILEKLFRPEPGSQFD